MPQPVAYIAHVDKSASKMMLLRERRGITEEMIDEAVVLTPVDASWWDTDERGWRLFVVGRTSDGRSMHVVLYPVSERDGDWRLGTARWTS